MTELSKHSARTPACRPGIGVGGREIGYMFGQYKRLRNEFTGVLTGKGLTYGGSLERTQATGYGLCYFTNEMLKDNGKSFEGKTVVISGSGNVAIYANEKATQLGPKVVAMSDSGGYIYDEKGIDLSVVKQIKEVERGRISEYAKRVSGSTYTEGCRGIWTVKCDIALPCATQNELDGEGAAALIANGCFAVCEGANMPSTPEPSKRCRKPECSRTGESSQPAASHIGLEMSQNSIRMSWSFDEVDEKLHGIMKSITRGFLSSEGIRCEATSSPPANTRLPQGRRRDESSGRCVLRQANQ